MSENERKELSEKLHFGLALAERRMLEEKALRNECIIQGLPNGEIKSVPARTVLRRLYGEEVKNKYEFIKAKESNGFFQPNFKEFVIYGIHS